MAKAKASSPLIKYERPQKIFLMVRSKEQIKRLYPIPYLFLLDVEKIKNILP